MRSYASVALAGAVILVALTGALARPAQAATLDAFGSRQDPTSTSPPARADMGPSRRARA